MTKKAWRDLLLKTAVALLAAGCCQTPSNLDLDGKCKPRTLIKMDSCQGEDRSFQECRFYFRATGQADNAWCQSLAEATETEPSKECDSQNSNDKDSACDPEACKSPSAFKRVDCDKYGVQDQATCYTCADVKREANKNYVYIYSPDCSRGAEKVTCKYSPTTATSKLGSIR